MRRDIITPREGWEDEVEALGFGFHMIDGQAYRREDACYVFDEAAVDTLEAAIAELHGLCLNLSNAGALSVLASVASGTVLSSKMEPLPGRPCASLRQCPPPFRTLDDARLWSIRFGRAKYGGATLSNVVQASQLVSREPIDGDSEHFICRSQCIGTSQMKL